MTQPLRFVIIGADAAGMSAASEARRFDRSIEITAFDRGSYASYSQCGLPYLVGGLVGEPGRLIARTVEEFANRSIVVKLNHLVTAILPQQRMIQVKDLKSGLEFTQPYDRLLIATGASPARSHFSGLDLEGVFHLDIMEDALAIQKYLRDYRPQRAVVVGGGYIGLEMAENLVGLGLQVYLVQSREQLFPSVDLEIALHLQEEMAKHGVNVSLCDSVVEGCAGDHGRVIDVHTNQGDILADLVILAAGTRPNVALGKLAGIQLGSTGAIAVNERLQTNLTGIYAAGDCAEHWHRILEKPSWVPLGTTANKQGRIAGLNAAGGNATFAGIVGTAITRVFDLEVGRTGLTEREATAAGIKCVATILKSTNHAGYMPDKESLILKLVAEQTTGRLLGGQVVAGKGADKRIDVLATALYNNLTLQDLTRLDLAYAPPFNSVWDPLQVAATSLLRQK